MHRPLQANRPPRAHHTQILAFREGLGAHEKTWGRQDRFKEAVRLLAKGERLPRRYRDHPLKGEYEGCRDCHLKHDWVLIYAFIGENELRLVRTGSHADLFE